MVLKSNEVGVPSPLNTLVPAEEALSIVLEQASTLPVEQVNLHSAADRILSKDLVALRTQPPFNASAMDGYAVKQSDIITVPCTLKLAGTSRAGIPFAGVLNQGEAVRIFTGAVVPEGADSIVIQENVNVSSNTTIEVKTGVSQGRFIRPAGLDFKEGDCLLKAGERLSSYKLALAASMNHPQVEVYKKPVVALISTGDELVLPGQRIEAGQIIASNTFGLSSSIRNCGAELLDLGIVPDTNEELFAAFEDAINGGADLVVTTGGASVGDHDLVLPVGEKAGFKFEISKIAMRPGKPFLFGSKTSSRGKVFITGLAGNPVSSLVAFNVFVKPLIEKLAGAEVTKQNRLPAKLGCALPQNDERAEYMRATLEITPDGERIATPFSKQDSSMLANLVKADCLVYRPIAAPAAKQGDRCEIVLIA